MLQTMKKRIKNEKGLTLIELLAVIVILAIIAAIAIPAIGNIIENSRYKAVKSDAINVINSAQIYFADNPDKKSVNVKTLLEQKFLDNAGKLGGGIVVYSPGTTDNTTSQNVIDGTSKKFSGESTVTFTKANIAEINDAKKSDTSGNVTVGTTTPTAEPTTPSTP